MILHHFGLILGDCFFRGGKGAFPDIIGTNISRGRRLFLVYTPDPHSQVHHSSVQVAVVNRICSTPRVMLNISPLRCSHATVLLHLLIKYGVMVGA